MTNLAIKDGAMGKIWQGKLETLNRTTKDLLDDVGKALEAVKEDADSTIVDEIYHYGSNILGATSQIFQGMNTIFDTVGSLLEGLNKTLDVGKNVVTGLIRGIGDIF